MVFTHVTPDTGSTICATCWRQTLRTLAAEEAERRAQATVREVVRLADDTWGEQSKLTPEMVNDPAFGALPVLPESELVADLRTEIIVLREDRKLLSEQLQEARRALDKVAAGELVAGLRKEILALRDEVEQKSKQIMHLESKVASLRGELREPESDCKPRQPRFPME